MPYLTCQRCRIPVYSAARYSTSDGCPSCGAPLAETLRSLFSPVMEPAATHGASERAPRDRFAQPAVSERPAKGGSLAPAP
jgi:hypothetical protein